MEAAPSGQTAVTMVVYPDLRLPRFYFQRIQYLGLTARG
jgi:hypothetical protein